MMKEEEELICRENTSFEIKEDNNIEIPIDYESK